MPNNNKIQGFADGQTDDNSGYTIYNHTGQTQTVEPHHTPIIDKHLENNDYKSVDNFYNPNHIPSNTVKITKDNVTKDYDVRSKEYKDLYNSGHLASYDAKTNTYYATPLKEVTITAEAPQWLKDKRQFEKEYTKDMFIDETMPKWSRSMGISATNMNPNNIAEYNKRINDKVVENIFKRKPTFDTDYSNDRLKTLQGFSQKELELIKNSSYASKIEPSIWSKFEQGLLSVGNAGSPVTFKNSSLTQEEAKKEDNPLNILQPLSIPSKMVQSTYKKDYSFTDALKGKQNNANIGEDILTDPLNLVGLGIWSKLSKANKFRNLDEAYQSIKGLSKEEGLSKLNGLQGNEYNINDILRLPDEHPIFKNFDKSYHQKLYNMKGEKEYNQFANTAMSVYKDWGVVKAPKNPASITDDNIISNFFKDKTTKEFENKLKSLDEWKQYITPEEKLERFKLNKDKFINTKNEFPDYRSQYGDRYGIDLTKKDNKIQDTFEHIKDFDKNINNAINAKVEKYYNNPSLGLGNYGTHWTTFLNSHLTKAGQQAIKNHELDHYLYALSKGEGQEFQKVFNLDNVKESGYLKNNRGSSNGDELRARIGQLLDYYEFKVQPNGKIQDIIGNSKFTKQHLDYAIKNYIKQTGLDNSMSLFFKKIKDKEGFIKLANKYAYSSIPLYLYLQNQQNNKEQ